MTGPVGTGAAVVAAITGAATAVAATGTATTLGARTAGAAGGCTGAAGTSAAGAGVGTAALNIHADRFGSSLLKEMEGASVDGTPRQVPVVTIDGVCAEKKLAGPYLIKVDVQGAELVVLAGARRTLEESEAVVLETTLFGTLVGGPQLYDVIVKMKEYGFVVYDIYGLTYRPLDQALLQADIVFVREQGRFRESHVFATPEQRREQLCRAEETHRKLTAGSGEKEKLG